MRRGRSYRRAPAYKSPYSRSERSLILAILRLVWTLTRIILIVLLLPLVLVALLTRRISFLQRVSIFFLSTYGRLFGI